jgi:hypothetical protein
MKDYKDLIKEGDFHRARAVLETLILSLAASEVEKNHLLNKLRFEWQMAKKRAENIDEDDEEVKRAKAESKYQQELYYVLQKVFGETINLMDRLGLLTKEFRIDVTRG